MLAHWRGSYEMDSAGRSKLIAVVAVGSAVGLGLAAQYLLVERGDLSAGLTIWALALGFFAVGIWQATPGRRSSMLIERGDDGIAERLTLRSELGLLAAVLAVGGFLRYYKLGSIPEGLNHDAAWNGLYAIQVTEGLVDLAPYATEAWRGETFFRYLIAGSQLLVGQTTYAIFLTSAIIGMATLAVFYVFIRQVFEPRLALIATFLLSVSGWHVTFSKVGWRAILVPLFAALVFFFLTRAMRERRLLDFVLAGIALGVSLYTYDAARILPIAALVYVTYELIRRPSVLRTHWAHLVAFSASFVITFAPLGWYALHHWDTFTERGRFLWIGTQIERAGSIEPLFVNLKNAALIFNFRANGNDFFVDEPLLDIPTSVFFVLGLVIAVLRIRQPGHLLLLTILALGLVVGIVSIPNGNRAIVTVLPAVTFAAIFLYEAWSWLCRAYPRGQAWFTLALLVVLLFVGYSTYNSYVGPDRRTQAGFFPETTIVGRYIHRVASENAVYAASGDWAADTLTYLSYQGEGDPFLLEYRYTAGAGPILEYQPFSATGTVYIIKVHPQGVRVFERLQRRFPAASTDVILTNDNPPSVIANVVLVPPGGGAGADFSAYVEPGADQRDAQRRQDLQAIADALEAHAEEAGGYPTTDGYIEVGCVLTEGPLCQFQDEVGPETFADPRGRPIRYGYWYTSDGNSFALYASLEEPIPQNETCTAADPVLAWEPSLFCVRG